MDKMRMCTRGIVEENVRKIGTLFPNCLTEMKDSEGNIVRGIDFDVLRQELSDRLVEGYEERYRFDWPDKREAILLANRPTSNTLRPCRTESVNFDNTQNLYIEGDNLEVLKIIRETYLGKIKMIYIDPPYNTGNDFVYSDDFFQNADYYKENSGQLNVDGEHLVQNTESNGRFHTDWVNMIYPRLKVAKDLLSDDGVIFISIDDNEQGNLKKVCDEIFGESNFVGELIHQRAKGGGQAKYVVKGHDYILVYGKNIKNLVLVRKKIIQKPTIKKNGEFYIINDDVVRKMFGKYDKSLGDRRCFYEELVQYKGEAKKQEIDNELRKGNLFLQKNKYGLHTICKLEKVSDATSKLYSILKINPENSIIKVLSEEGKKELDDLEIKGFAYPKPVDIIIQLIDAGSKKCENHIILDFFSGSATTAHAVMQLNAEDGGNRKFIMVQLPEKTDEKSEAYKAGYKNICEIGKERIRRAGKKIKEENADKEGIDKLDTGFRVLKLDSSNMQDVYYMPKEFTERELFADNVKPDRTAEDLLFQAMLELGVELSDSIEQRMIDGKQVFFVNDNYLVACFDENITESTITKIAQMKPIYFVMRDSSLASDNVADNFDQLFETYSKNTIRKII